MTTDTHAVAGAPTRAVLVGVDLGPDSGFDPTLDELALLAASAGDEVVGRVTARRKAPDAALFVGALYLALLIPYLIAEACRGCK